MVIDEGSSLIKLLGEVGSKKTKPKRVTFSTHIDDGENTDEILEVLETGDKQVQNKVDFDLNDVESQVKNMEAEMNSLEYRYSIKISSSKSNSKMDGIESEKLYISDNEIYHLSTDGQMTELSLLKNLVLEIGI